MNLNIEKLPEYTLVKVMDSKLDTNIAPDLKSELVVIAGNGESNMVLDLSNCQYCDSSGLSAILVANRLCKNANGTFVLMGLTETVEELIKLSQIDTVVNIAASADQVKTFFKSEEV